MRKQKFLSIVVLAVAALATSGCNGLHRTTGASKVKVGFVTDTYVYFGTEVDGDKVGKSAETYSEINILGKTKEKKNAEAPN